MTRRIRWFIVAALCIQASLSVYAKHPKSLMERIEWTWKDEPETPDPALPNVLLLGDSITRNYFPAVQKELAGKANVYLFATSAAAADPQIDWQIKNYLRVERVHFAVVHFNNGLHGWGYTDDEYGKALPSLVRVIRSNAPGAKLIWTTTTPIKKDLGQATKDKVRERNRIALTIMQAKGIPVDDQFALMSNHGDLYSDDEHFNEAGSAIQGKQAAAEIRKVLPNS